MPVRTCSLIATTIYPNHSAGNRSGLRRGEASVYTSPCSGGTARFRRLLCPLLTSATGSPPLTVRSVRLWTTRQISRGEHAFLRTRAPSIPIWPIMDRGLCLVLQARPTKPACRRSRLRGLGSCSSPRALAVPCRSRAASFPGTAAGYPVAIPLYRCRSLRSLSHKARVSAALQLATIWLGLGLDER